MRTSTRALAALVLGVCGSGLAGCRTGLVIKSWEPGAVAIGRAKELVMLQSSGKRSAREAVSGIFQDETRAAGYFTFTDKEEAGAEVKVVGRAVRLSGARLEEGQLGLRVDVHDWNTRSETRERSTMQGNVRKVFHQEVMIGVVSMGVTCFNREEKALTAEKEYEGTAEGDTGNSEAVLAAAARDAVSRFLAEITPRQVQRVVWLDTTDPNLKPYIQSAQSGDLNGAIAGLKPYAEQNPTNAAAAYDLAVFYDATGDYASAMASYDTAISLSPHPEYQKARAACAQRAAAADALAK